MFWLNVAFLVLGGAALGLLASGLPMPDMDFPLLLGPWHPMEWQDWAVTAALAVLIVGVATGVAVAYQSPKPEVIAAFDYCYMIFAVFWGYVFFREVPDIWTVAGMALIVAGGIGLLAVETGSRQAVALAERA